MFTKREIEKAMDSLLKDAPTDAIKESVQVFCECVLMELDLTNLRKQVKDLGDAVSNVQIPTEYYINVETGDALQINFAVNRPELPDFVKVSEDCFCIHTR